MDKISFTRQQLYDLVWSQRTIAIAQDNNISDYTLRKVCKDFQIPLPYAGYWNILKHGKSARKVKLPTNFTGKDEIIIETIKEQVVKNASDPSVRTQLIREIEDNHKDLIEVHARLTNPDFLIIKAKEDLTNEKEHRWTDNGLISTRAGYLNIKVAPANVPRALRFMDALIKLLRARGHQTNSSGTHIVVFGQELIIYLQEKHRTEDVIEGPYNWKTRKYYASGILTFRIWKDWVWKQKMWVDGKTLIEDQLAKIMAGIELYAKKKIQEQIELEAGWARQAEQRRIEEERKAKIEQEKANIQRLFDGSKKWRHYRDILDYIDEVEKRACQNAQLTAEIKDWLIWAREKAEMRNPFNDL